MVDGLWSRYQNASLGDFPTVLKRIKLLGFNGLRLPFTFADLDKAPSQRIYVSGCKVSDADGSRDSDVSIGCFSATLSLLSILFLFCVEMHMAKVLATAGKSPGAHLLVLHNN